MPPLSPIPEAVRVLTRICTLVARLAEALLAAGFAALIVTVGLQVLARNVLKIPLIWTGDMAQLLFGWLIFVGAACAYRRGVHYTVDLLPESWDAGRRVLDLFGFALALVVIYVLIVHGWTLAEIRRSGTVQSLGISRFWMFLPIPVSGALMLLFWVEHLADTARRLRA